MMSPGYVMAVRAQWEAYKQTPAYTQHTQPSLDIYNEYKNKCVAGTKNCAKKQRTNCVDLDKSKMGSLMPELGAAVNKAKGTNIDFSKVSQWEGGMALKAYVPWWPDVTDQGRMIQYKMSDGQMAWVADGQILGGVGNRNRSGVTVGKGVDLGPKNKEAYFKELDAANKRSGLLTDVELKRLKDKIGPYVGKRMAEACKYLRDNPLELDNKEANLLTQQALEENIDKSKKQYQNATGKPFGDLPQEEQTVLFSRVYQTGNMPPGLAQAMAKPDWAAVMRTLGTNPRTRTGQEGAYMQDAYYDRFQQVYWQLAPLGFMFPNVGGLPPR